MGGEGGDKEGREGSRGTQYAHPGRLGHCSPGSVDDRPPPQPPRTGFECEGNWSIVGCCHTMSNQYELPRAVGPQRHISSKVALNAEMVAALKVSSIYRIETWTSSSSGVMDSGVNDWIPKSPQYGRSLRPVE